jgi:hypothetical protein
MSLTTAQQKAIIAHDGQFASLALSGFPALNESPETSRDDGRFASHWNDTPLSASATALRNFVLDPDSASLERVGEEIGYEDFRNEVRQRKGESVCGRFKAANPDYLPTDANYRAIVETLSWNALSAADQEGTIDEQVDALIDGGFWTEPNLTATYNALNAEGFA